MNLARIYLSVFFIFLAHLSPAQTDVQRMELRGPVKYYHHKKDRKGIPDGKGNGLESIYRQYYHFSPQGMTMIDSLRYKYKYEDWAEWKEWLHACYAEQHPGGKVVKRLDIADNEMQDERTYYKYDKQGRLIQIKWFYMGNDDTIKIDVTRLSYYPDGKLKTRTSLRGPSDRTLVYQYEYRFRYEENKEINTIYHYWGTKFKEAERTETTYDTEGRKVMAKVYEGKKLTEVNEYSYSDSKEDPPHMASPVYDKEINYSSHIYWYKDDHGNYLRTMVRYPRTTEYTEAEIGYY